MMYVKALEPTVLKMVNCTHRLSVVNWGDWLERLRINDSHHVRSLSVETDSVRLTLVFVVCLVGTSLLFTSAY